MKYLVVRSNIDEIDKIPVTDLKKAEALVKKVGKQKFKHKGRYVEILGLYTEEEMKVVDLFHKTAPSEYEIWRENMRQFAKTKEWPKR